MRPPLAHNKDYVNQSGRAGPDTACPPSTGENRGEAVNALKRAIYTGRVAPTQARRADETQARFKLLR